MTTTVIYVVADGKEGKNLAEHSAYLLRLIHQGWTHFVSGIHHSLAESVDVVRLGW